MGRFALAVVAGLVLVVFALAGSAQAAMSRPTGVTFVLLSGRHAGERVKTDGGPNVPARLNGGRISGRLIPQSEGNEFTFKGTVRARGRASAQAADSTDAEALPQAALSGFNVADALYEEELQTVLSPEVQKRIVDDIGRAIGQLDALRDGGRITANQHDDLVADLSNAEMLDKAGAKDLHDALKAPRGSHKRARLEHAGSRALAQAQVLKTRVLAALHPLELSNALVPAEPPPTPVTQPPLDLAPGEALAISNRTGAIAGTQDPGTPGSRGFVFQNGSVVYQGPAGSAFYAFGPSGSVGGQFNGQAIVVPSLTGPLVSLPEGNATGGGVRAGDDDLLVGFVTQRAAPFERAATWFRAPASGSRARASRLRFTGYKVGRFAGGSSLFAVSGPLAFGDHFDRGTTGPFRAFRVELRTGVLTELFRPAGGSSQPLASNRARVGAGASRFANGALQATYWWGAQHYLRFGGPGVDSLVAGMNEAGVGVGAIGPPGNHHAALFERGVAYDLNSLIPSGSGWTLTKANAISNAGVIVGTGILNGQQRAFALNLSSPR